MQVALSSRLSNAGKFEQRWNSAAARTAGPASGVLAGAVHCASTEDPESITLSAPPSGIVEGRRRKAVYSVRETEIEALLSVQFSSVEVSSPKGSLENCSVF